MKKIRIALISDLHVGTENRGMDMCPHQLKPDEAIGRNEDYILTLERQAKEFLEHGPIDMLCVTGDISNRAHSEEFSFADRAIKRIMTVLGIADDSIYFVPGNHDIHWPVMQLKPTNFWGPYRYEPLLQPHLTFKRRISESSFGALDRNPFFISWNDEKALVIGINSAAFDGPESDNHCGIIQEETIQGMNSYLDSISLNFNQLRICLLHHHPIQYSEKIPNMADLSIAVNSEHLLSTLAKHSFDLLLHGHKHQPRLKTHLMDNCHPFISLCAGSFSSVLHPLYFDGSSNLFHILNIEGRDSSSDGVQGTLNSWTHSADGTWRASDQSRGIPAKEAFGSLATPTQIKKDLLHSISEAMKSTSLCEWNSLIKIYPHLEFVNSSVAYRVMTDVTKELGLEMAGDNNGHSHKWVIFRRSP